MITSSSLYWITRLDTVVIAMRLSPAVVLVAGLVGVAIFSDIGGCYEIKRIFRNLFIAFLSLSILVCAGSIFVPTTKEYCAIYAIPKIANNEKVQNEAKEIYEIAKSWLAEQVNKKEERK